MSASWWIKQGAASGAATQPAAASTSTNIANSTNSTTTSSTQTAASGFASFFAKPSAKPASNNAAPVPQPQGISSQVVLEILKGFRLEGAEDKFQTSMVFAKCNGKVMGGDDARLVGLRWFRAAEGGKFEELGVSRPFYQPTIDDVDKRLCVQCYDLHDETSSSFAEYGPIVMDPRVTAGASNSAGKIKGKLGGEDVEISRSLFPPNHVVLKRTLDGSIIEEQIFTWRVLANESKRVLVGEGREIEFSSAVDRDIATLLVRTNPPRSKTGSVGSLEEVLSGPAHPNGNGDSSTDHNSRSQAEQSAVEKQLKEKIMELEAQLMAVRARGGAAETGKALAEAQSLRRELDKLKTENASLVHQLENVRKSKSELEDKLKNIEGQVAQLAVQEDAKNHLQRELETTKEALEKSQNQLRALRDKYDKTQLEMDRLDQKIPAIEQRAKQAEDRVKELEQKLSQAQQEAERAIGRKNAALQKADSLAKDLARVLKATPGGLEEVEATMKENATLKSTIEEMRNELKATRMAYEAQIAAGKVHSAKATSAMSGVNVLGLASASQSANASKKASQLEHLANSLMSDVKEKDELIEKQKSEIQRLQLRLQEFQKRQKDPHGSLSN